MKVQATALVQRRQVHSHKDSSATADAQVKLNQKVMEQLSAKLSADPDLEIKEEFETIWEDALLAQYPRKALPVPRKTPKPPQQPGDFARGAVSTILQYKKSLGILYPLSPQAESVIFGEDERSTTKPTFNDALARCLHRRLGESQLLFEATMGGAVVWKISDSLVAKLSDSGGTTEYSTLMHLAEHAPRLPVPKPHGLITWGSCQLALLTYFPSMTLQDAWPSLSEDNKKSISAELNTIVEAWRSIPVKRGVPLGGIGGEGVQDYHGWAGDETKQVMTTAQEFTEWQFSYKHPMPATWREFVRSVTPSVGPDEPIVITHGDLWPPNIMVDKTEDGKFYVTGIVDWADSGFYPSYFELSRMLSAVCINDDNGWWKYIPPCISPSSDPQRWLATRLWHLSCR